MTMLSLRLRLMTVGFDVLSQRLYIMPWWGISIVLNLTPCPTGYVVYIR
jgi:hypothetical protein